MLTKELLNGLWQADGAGGGAGNGTPTPNNGTPPPNAGGIDSGLRRNDGPLSE